MSRNFLIILAGVLAVVAAVASYLYYEESQSGLEIKIDEGGISVDGN